MVYNLLLTEDVEALGRKGDVVRVKPGYARNFLIPTRKGIVAGAQTLKRQAKLKEEREMQAAVELKESKAIAAQLNDLTLEMVVKVDHEGHMYGSVTVLDLIHQIKEVNQIELSKKAFNLKHPIKTLGLHEIELKLSEGVTCSISLNVESEGEAEKE
ncbi:50S ribosomal protein L9 [Chlamydiales bacterium]|nr:50S ribosomal protein L9 [Chlamydiales bacterium]